MKSGSAAIKQLRGGLIVSCQAAEGEPLCAPEHIAALALSAINGGACGLRLEGTANIAFVRGLTSLPIIGLTKATDIPEHKRMESVYITPTFEDAQSLANCGCDIIALDATARIRPGGASLQEMISRIHTELGKPVWADVATLEEGLNAAVYGADVISTTLSGYTLETKARAGAGPDLDLLSALSAQVEVPVILEGQVWHPSEVTEAFARAAYAVVVGSAITRPQLITQRFVAAIPPSN